MWLNVLDSVRQNNNLDEKVFHVLDRMESMQNEVSVIELIYETDTGMNKVFMNYIQLKSPIFCNKKKTNRGIQFALGTPYAK